jgi:hypothetical protein
MAKNGRSRGGSRLEIVSWFKKSGYVQQPTRSAARELARSDFSRSGFLEATWLALPPRLLAAMGDGQNPNTPTVTREADDD